jgi:hypothetical protein
MSKAHTRTHAERKGGQYDCIALPEGYVMGQRGDVV